MLVINKLTAQKFKILNVYWWLMIMHVYNLINSLSWKNIKAPMNLIMHNICAIN